MSYRLSNDVDVNGVEMELPVIEGATKAEFLEEYERIAGENDWYQEVDDRGDELYVYIGEVEEGEGPVGMVKVDIDEECGLLEATRVIEWAEEQAKCDEEGDDDLVGVAHRCGHVVEYRFEDVREEMLKDDCEVCKTVQRHTKVMESMKEKMREGEDDCDLVTVRKTDEQLEKERKDKEKYGHVDSLDLTKFFVTTSFADNVMKDEDLSNILPFSRREYKQMDKGNRTN